MTTFTVCLTHDVDRTRKTFQYISHSLKALRNRNYNQVIYHVKSLGRKNPYWNFEKIMALENEYQLRSTFFFLNETTPFKLFSPGRWKLSLGNYKLDSVPIKAIIRYLNDNGWEIGLHGSYNTYNDIELLSLEKRKLESVLGQSVIGIRQHYLNLEVPTTWILQSKVGFLYDASYGIRNRVGFPDDRYHAFRNNDSGMIILPLAIMDTYLFQLESTLDSIWCRCLKIIEEAEKKGALLVLLWHQRVFHEGEFPQHTKVYRKIIEECICRGAQFKLCREVYSDFISQS
jgi:peptidoglycan/xylan/chitin deacetylase (PgdA/CDA1 family)